MAEPVALAALALDAAFGWPAGLYRRIDHPVGGFARLIAACESRGNRPGRSDRCRRALGAATLVLLALAGGGTAWAVEAAIRAAAGPVLDRFGYEPL
jgi:adenosylcobinamide-phosphate synthase